MNNLNFKLNFFDKTENIWIQTILKNISLKLIF